MHEVQAYAYRVPRLPFELPVEYFAGGKWISGHTRDVSDTGVLVRLAEPVFSHTNGKVRLRFGTCTVEIEVRVAYTEFLEAGLSFCFGSEAERQFVQTLVRVLAKRAGRR